MNVLQLTSVPDGLQAVFLVVVLEDNERKTSFVLRPIDCMALISLNQPELRAMGDIRAAMKGSDTRIVGIIADGPGDPLPAPDVSRWMEAAYGEKFVGGKFLGYTRESIMDEEENVFPRWLAAANEALALIVK